MRAESDCRLVFPTVIVGKLDYSKKLNPSLLRTCTVKDARTLVRWYADVMTRGIAYQEYVIGSHNRAHPHALMRENFIKLRLFNGMGWSWKGVEPILDRAIPNLEQVPLDADMFETDAYDAILIQILSDLATREDVRGIRVANASKLVHQKRPLYIPVLDAYVRRALNIHYVDLYPQAFELGFARFRSFVSLSQNSLSLKRLHYWARTELSQGRIHLQLSKVRLVDIVAWSLLWKLDRNELDGIEKRAAF